MGWGDVRMYAADCRRPDGSEFGNETTLAAVLVGNPCRSFVLAHLATARPVYLAAVVARDLAADPTLADLLAALRRDDVAAARRLCGAAL